MTAGDLVVGQVDVCVGGVAVLEPSAGTVPVGHLVVDVDLGSAPDAVAACTRVSAGLHGSLDLVDAEAVGPARWRLEIPAVLLGADFRLSVRGSAERGDAHELAVVSGRNGRFGERRTGIQALLMHQLGRAGSTMMMRLLAGHPELAVFDDYPLETRPGLAWMHELAVLLGTQTVRPGDEPFFDEVDVATANPYLSEYFVGSEILAARHRGGFAQLRDAIVGMVEDTYLERRPGAAFFAEKFRIESRHAVRTQQATLATWPASRQIVLVRDPRDLLCSRLSFNRQRSEASFDLDLTDDAVTGAPTIVHHLQLAAAQVDAFADAIVVRYEDLVERPVATATRLFGDLGLDRGFTTVRRAVDHAIAHRSAEHVTSSSPAASIGRWRAELPAEAAAHLAAELSDELARFGYDR